MQPTYRQIEYLRAVAEHKSFSAAAIQCHVTQSTLSSGIRDLETILGVQLFIRTSREVYLTPEGQVLFEDSHRLFDDMQGFVETAKGFSSLGGGVLRVGIIPTIAPYILKDLHASIQNKYPDMHIHLHEDVSAALMDKLNGRLLDVVIMAFPYPVGSYGHELIGHDALHLIAHDTLDIKPKGANKNLSIYDIQDVPMIMLADGHCLRDHALAACSLQERGIIPSYQAVTMASLLEMVGAGLGATLVPSLMLNSRALSLPKGVIKYDFSTPVPERQIGIVWQRADLKAKAMDIQVMTKALLQKY
jgi:LysR family hydrogen peroxide-inducible transcriptional activator